MDTVLTLRQQVMKEVAEEYPGADVDIKEREFKSRYVFRQVSEYLDNLVFQQDCMVDNVDLIDWLHSNIKVDYYSDVLNLLEIFNDSSIRKKYQEKKMRKYGAWNLALGICEHKENLIEDCEEPIFLPKPSILSVEGIRFSHIKFQVALWCYLCKKTGVASAGKYVVKTPIDVLMIDKEIERYAKSCKSRIYDELNFGQFV